MCSDGELRKSFSDASLDMLTNSTASPGYFVLFVAGLKCFLNKQNRDCQNIGCHLFSEQFFEAVAANSSTNLMDASNISIVMAPTLMPVHIAASSRNDRQNCSTLQNSAKVIQVKFLVGFT